MHLYTCALLPGLVQRDCFHIPLRPLKVGHRALKNKIKRQWRRWRQRVRVHDDDQWWWGVLLRLLSLLSMLFFSSGGGGVVVVWWWCVCVCVCLCLLLISSLFFFFSFLMGWIWERDDNVRLTSRHTHLSSRHTSSHVGYFTQHCD